MTTIDMKMEAIYRAAHTELPLQATKFATHANSVSGNAPRVSEELRLAGNHPIVDDVDSLADELFLHLRAMVKTLNDSAVALDRIADDFVQTDADASRWFQQQAEQYGGDPDIPSLPSQGDN